MPFILLSPMKKWLKNIAVDILATAAIALLVFYPSFILEIVVYIYTGLMALARSITLFSKNFRDITKKKVDEAPVWMYHLLYFLNTLLLLIGTYYVTAVGWIFIWGVATFVYMKSTNKK